VYPDARNPFAHTSLLADEGLEAWAVGEVWLIGTPSPDHFVDITDTYERKLAALRAHVSQTSHMDELDTMLRGWLTANAVEAKLAPGRLAEGFTILRTE
jgi:LmbE family N-acetylglucosaminyl deacetylase